MNSPFKIGPWLVEPELNRLTKKREVHTLEPRLMRLLVLLAETPNKLVSKDDIIGIVWQGLSVTDESLSQAISKLRKLLGDDPDAPTYIGTIRKKGYRLLAAVKPSGANGGTKPASIQKIAAATVLILAVGVFYWASQTPINEPGEKAAFLVSQLLTNAAGRERDPSISPDGSFLVYSKSSEDQGQNIFLHGIGRGVADRQLTDRGRNFAPVVMPTNNAVIFMRLQNTQCSVMLLDLIDGAERVVGDCAGSSFPDTTVSSDGSLIAFGARSPEQTTHAIYLLNPTNGERTRLTTPPSGIWGDYDPVFSTNGSTLYFARSVSEAMQDVYKIDIGSGLETRLTFDGRNIMGLARAGGETIFASNRDGRYGMWSLGHETNRLGRMEISQSGIINPTVSRGGDRLIYEVVNRVVALQSYADQIASPRVLLQFNAEILHPTTASDRIAFSSNRSGFFEIWDADKTGNGLRRLTDFRTGFTAHPRFSPNGDRIAFDARPNGSAQIYVMNQDGSNLAAVSAAGINRYAPTWLPDGSGLVYAKETGGTLELWALNLSTQQEKQLTKTGGYFGYITEGGTLFHVRPNMPGVWQLAAGEQEPKLVIEGLEFSDWGNWRVAGGTISYFHRQTRSVMSFDLSAKTNNTQRLIDGFVPTADPAVAFNKDGSLALAGIRKALESDIEYVDIGPPQPR